jgi:hypothetical protein
MTDLWLIVLGAAVAGIAVYAVSLRLHPWGPCRSCHGTGKTRDRIWKPASGTCGKCHGGRRPRLGVRVLQPSRARAMTPARGARRSADRRN